MKASTAENPRCCRHWWSKHCSWRNTDANASYWRLDSNSNFVSRHDWIDPNSVAGLAFETNFNLDLNDDGAIVVLPTIHKAGSVAFQKDSGTGFYASQLMVEIQLKSPSKENRSMKASTAAGKPPAVDIRVALFFGRTPMPTAHTWRLDSNWNFVSRHDWIDPNSVAGRL